MTCPLCRHPERAACARCGRPACGACDRCGGCGRTVCQTCESTARVAFIFAGDRYPHPHCVGMRRLTRREMLA